MAGKTVNAHRTSEERKSADGEQVPLARGKHVDAAVRGIKDAIFRGELRPGEPLRETDCEDKYGVSRTPFRSALVRLTEEGLLEKWGNVTVVRAATQADVVESMTLRYAIESMVVTILADRARPGDVHQLETIQERMIEVVAKATIAHARERHEAPDRGEGGIDWRPKHTGGSRSVEGTPARHRKPQPGKSGGDDSSRNPTDEFIDLDMDFHSTIAELAGHPFAAKLLRELRQRVRVFVVRDRGIHFDSERMQATVEQHGLIIKAIKDGQAGVARRHIFCHLKSVAAKCYPWAAEDLQNLDNELRLSRPSTAKG